MDRIALRSAALASTGSLLGLSAGALGAALVATPAGATVYTVTNLNDGGAGSLRQAITDANANAGLDTITFAGNVTGTIELALSLPDITEGLTIAGPGSDVLAVSGGGLYHAFTLETNFTGGVIISGLTITESMGILNASGDIVGGAIAAFNTGVVLDDVHLVENHADSNSVDTAGGGLYVKNQLGSGDVIISNSILTRNSALSTVQGDLGNGGGAVIEADNIEITDTVIRDNDADFGGGLYAAAVAGAMDVERVSVLNNFSTFYGGGLLIGGHNVNVADSIVTGNVSGNAMGGAYIGASANGQSLATLTVTNTNISNNSAAELGGALIFNIDPNGVANIDRTTVAGNVGEILGGLSVMGSSNVTSSTIANNTGAGLHFGNLFGPVSIGPASSVQPAVPAPQTNTARVSNSTISGNSREGIAVNIDYGMISSATFPSALAPSSQSVAPLTPPVTAVDLGLVHVLAADNGMEDVAAPAISLFSLIERPNAGVLAGYGTQVGVDPQLQPLQQVSPTVAVVPILPGTPAWDGGYPDFTPPPSTDQRGLPRVVQIIDIGAYEVQEYFARPRFTG